MSGLENLRMPDDLREGVKAHLRELKKEFLARGWGARMGFGKSPAVIVVDLAKGWTRTGFQQGSDLDSVVESTRQVLDAARRASVPIIFTVVAYDPDDPQGPWELKHPRIQGALPSGSEATELDPKLGRLPNEKLLVKKYTSCFQGTNLYQILAGLEVDTLIVTGCSTSHCVNDTCRDGMSSFRMIVAEEAVGDRCEILHLAELLDLDAFAADVLPTEKVVAYLNKLPAAQVPQPA